MNTKQTGFSLFIVLISMLVIAFLVIAGIQGGNTEMRISANDADRKIALSRAETALRVGEREVGELNPTAKFTVDCKDTALCVPAGGINSGTDVYGSGDYFGILSQTDILQSSCVPMPTCNVSAWERDHDWKKHPHIIEYLGVDTSALGDTFHVFRVTARAHGNNANTVVTLQSNIQATFPVPKSQ
ncbi:pilus assembly PilX family protein [Stenoxybacter acetivorans]|uniref:pilus assembly PilX family protein n=1 Tax=Stenoxybacter acetivorans TaxID=422441 RepID=UPI00055F3D8E|nr:PilX N-terminal domain-containing pilus assembly protein [Stenoxybacter acetivorans]